MEADCHALFLSFTGATGCMLVLPVSYLLVLEISTQPPKVAGWV
jgi:hypothetical protein